MKDILLEREKRAKKIEKIISYYNNKTILTLKLNIPGKNKNLFPFHIALVNMHQIIKTSYKQVLIDEKFIRSDAGDTFVFVLENNPLVLKKETINLEQKSPVNRLVDLDVFDGQKWLSRQDVNMKPRKCYVCNRDAHDCARSQRHDVILLLNKMKETVIDFYTEKLVNDVESAIVSELKLYPKAGLVSHIDSGCHNDMNYQLFLRSKDSILPYVKELVHIGFEEKIEISKLKQLGITAEKAMFKVTNNINTHKGLIFLLGLFIPAFINSLKKNDISFQEKMQSLAKQVIGSYYQQINEMALSNGDVIYQKYGIKGIRQEALMGLPSLFLFPFSNIENISDKHHQYLIEFMSVLDDTTIIHKTSLNDLYQVKNDMKQLIENGGYVKNRRRFLQLSNEYKKKNISPGGSADMLVIKILYENNINFLNYRPS